jgi:hypothetical protein
LGDKGIAEIEGIDEIERRQGEVGLRGLMRLRD